MIFTKLFDELESTRNKSRSLEFRNYGETETELKNKIQSLFEKAKTKWEGVFADSAKEVEIFLLNRRIDFEHVEPRNDKAEAVLVMETDTADANLVIFPQQMERVTMKYRDGRTRERIRADALRALLAE